MLNFVRDKLRILFERDPWLLLKFVSVTLALGLIGKAILYGAVDGCEIQPGYAQFVPTAPMLVLTFLAHRYLWGCRDISLWSYVGGGWTAAYSVQLVAGHGIYTLCTTVFGWQYLAVSVAIGFASACVTFALNELKILAKHSKLSPSKTAME